MAAPSIKWREATELGADGVVPLERPASNSFGTTPPARPFLEFDGLAGTPPNSGGEFQTRNCQLVHTFSRVGLHSDASREDSPFPELFCCSFRRHPDVEVIVVMLPAKPVQAFVAPAVYQDFRSKRVSAQTRHDTVMRVRTAGRHMPSSSATCTGADSNLEEEVIRRLIDKSMQPSQPIF